MPHCGKPVVPLSERLGYDVGETAALINSSVSFVYELIRRGELETVKVGGRRIVPRWALEALLSSPSMQCSQTKTRRPHLFPRPLCRP